MANFIRTLVIVLWMTCPAVLTAEPELSQEQMRSLDEQVQEIKSDVLGIASELSNLE